MGSGTVLAFARCCRESVTAPCLCPSPCVTGRPVCPPPVPESRRMARLASSAKAPQCNKALRAQRNAPSAYENQPTTTRISAYGMSTRSPKHGVSVQRHGVCPPRILLPVRRPSPRQRPTAGLFLPERRGTDPRPFNRTPRHHLQRTRPLVEQIAPPTNRPRSTRPNRRRSPQCSGERLLPLTHFDQQRPADLPHDRHPAPPHHAQLSFRSKASSG